MDGVAGGSVDHLIFDFRVVRGPVGVERRLVDELEKEEVHICVCWIV